MANAKTIEERYQKLIAEREELAKEFGEIILDNLDVTTPREFKKFVVGNKKQLEHVLKSWRESKMKQSTESNNEHENHDGVR